MAKFNTHEVGLQLEKICKSSIWWAFRPSDPLFPTFRTPPHNSYVAVWPLDVCFWSERDSPSDSPSKLWGPLPSLSLGARHIRRDRCTRQTKASRRSEIGGWSTAGSWVISIGWRDRNVLVKKGPSADTFRAPVAKLSCQDGDPRICKSCRWTDLVLRNLFNSRSFSCPTPPLIVSSEKRGRREQSQRTYTTAWRSNPPANPLPTRSNTVQSGEW